MMSAVQGPIGKIAILLLPLALGACNQHALTSASPAAAPKAFAWDGAGEDPNLPRPGDRRVGARATERPAESRDVSAPDFDTNLARKLVICSGCAKPPDVSDRADGSRLASR